MGARREGQGIAVRRLDPRAGGGDFLNRDAELLQLREALEGLVAGRSTRQLIVGEVGIGKSRLVAEALASALVPGVTILSGRALEFETDRPFGLLVDALELHATSADPERVTLSRLISHAREPGRAELRHQLVGEITQLVDRMCDSGPLALILEDVQWADSLSVGAITGILETLTDQVLGVILTTRLMPPNPPLEEMVSRARPRFTRLDLGGLPADAVGSLARSITDAQTSPALYSLLAGAGGNPAYVIGLLEGLRQEGSLRVDEGVADTDAVLPPRVMRPAVMARLGRLSDSCQDLLTVAAILGEPFTAGKLAVAAGRPVTGLLTELRQAMRARILAEVEGTLRFRQELVRVILYEETSASARSSLHLAIGRSLLASGADAQSVSYHLLRGATLGGIGSRPEEAPRPVAVELGPERWEKLTRAEREIARHVVEGRSNREIGDRLFVSARTVETHLTHIYAKLGVRSRMELAAVAVRAGRLLGRREDTGGRVGPPVQGEGKPS